MKLKDALAIDFNLILKYYETENHSAKETASHFNMTVDNLMYVLKQHSYHKPKNLHVNNIKKSKKDKYGDENYNNRDKSKITCLEKYGVDNVFKDKEKIKNSYLEKYNTDHPMHVVSVKEKVRANRDYKLEAQKRKETIENKYNCTLSEFNRKKAETGWGNKQEHLEKIYQTKKENNSFNASKPEDKYYDYLVHKYGEKNVFRQYSDDRYPFLCDFYIKSLDLFIELNFSWTHGYHPFDINNQEDLKLLDLWKKKAETSDFYKNAIETWTVRDVEKHKIAKDNNLRYVCYYNEEDLYENK